MLHCIRTFTSVWPVTVGCTISHCSQELQMSQGTKQAQWVTKNLQDAE